MSNAAENAGLYGYLASFDLVDEFLAAAARVRDAGYTQFTVQIVSGHEDAIEDWARIRQALV